MAADSDTKGSPIAEEPNDQDKTGDSIMLVLTRKNQQSVVVGNSNGVDRLLKVTVLEIRAGRVRLGFDVPAEVPVHRFEVWERLLTGEPDDNRTEIPAACVAS